MSCAQRIKVPINRGVSPEVLGEGFSIEYESKSFVEGSLQLDASQDLSNELSTSSSRESLYRFDFSPMRQFEFYLDLTKDIAPLFGVKIQFWGLPRNALEAGHKAALTLALGSGKDINEDDIEVELSAKTKDLSIIHGYRFSEKFLLYESLSLTRVEFNGEIQQLPITFTKDSFRFKDSHIYTLALGLEYSLGIIDLNLEYAYQESSLDSINKIGQSSFLFGATLLLN